LADEFFARGAGAVRPAAGRHDRSTLAQELARDLGVSVIIPEIVDRLNKAAAAAVKADAFKKLGVNEGLVMVASPPSELDRYLREEEERWRKVIQDAAIKAD